MNKLRLVIWNCADGFARKAKVLEALQADLAIICECRLAALEAVEVSEQQKCWIGEPNKRGLAVIGGEGWTLEVVSLDFLDKWFLPVIARRGDVELRLLALWVKPTEDYLAPTIRTLEKCYPFLSEGAAIVAGDFNSNVLWDKSNRKRRFAQVIGTLAELNLVSAWHSFTSEAHGQESKATYYHTFNETLPFHIDYIFVPDEPVCKIEKIEIGGYRDWVEKKSERESRLSDHVPIIVELTIL